MAYFQMDDGFETEPRVMRAGKPAFGLYAACGIWVARHLTDGFIPAEIAALYGTREWIEKLVTTGLWSPVEGGFEMPDYLALHNNPTAETVRKRRADAALRKQKQRAGRKPPNKSQGESRVTDGVTHGGSHGSQASPPPKGGEVGDAPLREGASPPTRTPTHKLTSGRVICATHHLELGEAGICRGCAADARVADIDDLDQRPPVGERHRQPPQPPPDADSAAPPTSEDDDALAAARILAALPVAEARRWRIAAEAEFLANGIPLDRRAVAIRAAELATRTNEPP